MIIRPLAAADRAHWDPLWQGYLEFYKASLLPEVSDVTFSRLTGGREPMGGFVAMDGDMAAGIVHWLTHRSCWTIEDYCYLQDLFTSEAVRGQGVGEALIRAVYAAAKAAGGSVVYWHTHETNAVARKLYDRVAANSGFLVYRQRL